MLGRAVMVCVTMCLSRVMCEVVSTKGAYGMLVPMNSFDFHMYAYLVQITVVYLVELRLNAANIFKVCYVTVIMLIG